MLASLAPALLALTALATPTPDDDRSRLALLRTKALVEAGQRHLEYGVQLRKEGLCVQAAEQIVRAVEVSGGQNPGALTVLHLMQDLEDRFWKRNNPRPGASKLDTYAREAKKLELTDQRERLEVASWAWTHQLWEDAHTEYVDILRRRGEALDFDKSGCIVLEAGRLPEKESQRVREEAVTINERLYLRDAFLLLMPEIKTVFEARSERLCVRSTRDLAEAQRISALIGALLPILENDLCARPTQRLTLVLLDQAELYDTYLDRARMPENKAATGFADKLKGLAIVCTGKATDEVQLAVCLHEMTHLFTYSISRATMPSWYDEGLAESYGGQGVFEWKDGKLSVGGLMPAARLDLLRHQNLQLKLRDLLATRAISALAQDELKGRAFYTQAWAFVRFLRTGAGDDIARRFAEWETMCKGALVDAVVLGAGPDRDKPPGASDLFLKSFGKDLPRLEDAFTAWLAKL